MSTYHGSSVALTLMSHNKVLAMSWWITASEDGSPQFSSNLVERFLFIGPGQIWLLWKLDVFWVNSFTILVLQALAYDQRLEVWFCRSIVGLRLAGKPSMCSGSWIATASWMIWETNFWRDSSHSLGTWTNIRDTANSPRSNLNDLLNCLEPISSRVGLSAHKNLIQWIVNRY